MLFIRVSYLGLNVVLGGQQCLKAQQIPPELVTQVPGTNVHANLTHSCNVDIQSLQRCIVYAKENTVQRGEYSAKRRIQCEEENTVRREIGMYAETNMCFFCYIHTTK